MASTVKHVIVGAETGLLKGINIVKGTWKNLNYIETPDKTNEITCLTWNDEQETCLTVGRKSNLIANYDVKTQIVSEFKPLVKGKGENLKAINKCDKLFVAGFETGHVSIQTNSETADEIITGSHLQCMTRRKNILGTGGKENSLKLYDINTFATGTPVFQAKNVRNDWLNLRVPVWVTGINFMEDNKIVSSTGHHQVRVYDPRVQRRPVLDMTFDEYPITAMSLSSDHQIVVGNTQGSMGLLDVRKGQLVHRFKGFAGGIRSIQCHESLSVVASCGLDRFLRVHDINTKQLLHRIYLKSRLNCLLMTKDSWSEDTSDTGAVIENNIRAVSRGDEENDDDDDDDDDIMWEQMQVVKTRTLKRKKVDTDEDNIDIKTHSKRKQKTAKK